MVADTPVITQPHIISIVDQNQGYTAIGTAGTHEEFAARQQPMLQVNRMPLLSSGPIAGQDSLKGQDISIVGSDLMILQTVSMQFANGPNVFCPSDLQGEIGLFAGRHHERLYS